MQGGRGGRGGRGGVGGGGVLHCVLRFSLVSVVEVYNGGFSGRSPWRKAKRKLL